MRPSGADRRVGQKKPQRDQRVFTKHAIACARRASANSEVFTKRLTGFWVRSPSVFFSAWGWFRLKVMTPLSRCPRTVRTKQQGLSVVFRNTRPDGAAMARHGRHGCPRTIFSGFHETRDTNHGFFFPCSRLFGIVQQKNIVLSQCPRAARSLLSCALWRGMGGYDAAWAAWGAPSHCSRTIRTSNMTIRVFTKHETRLLPDARQVPARIPRFSRDTNHETRITAFKLFFPRFPTISRHFPLFFGPPSPRKRCPSPVSRSRWVSRQAP